MISAGIDIGSRTVKLVVVENGEIILARKDLNSYNPLEVCKKIIDGIQYDTITATGYGRNLFRNHFDCRVISEIKAFAVGAGKVCPDCRTILDIGGQDTKAISLNETGHIDRFEMNDKCAAGTGKFLEIMATALGFGMEEFITAGSSTRNAVKINSMCTVFAESEVISMLAQGHDRAEIARGIHETICRRSAAMLKRVYVGGRIAFFGGVAMNSCVSDILSQEIGSDLFVPEDPQIVGALGCAYITTTKES
jgi:predicted CoA-substrate-specific enzyme activase